MGSSLTLIRADSSSTWLDFTTRLHTVHVGFVIVVKHSRPQQLRLSPVARTKNRYFPHVLTGPWTRPVCCTELRPRHYLAFLRRNSPLLKTSQRHVATPTVLRRVSCRAVFAFRFSKTLPTRTGEGKFVSAFEDSRKSPYCRTAH